MVGSVKVPLQLKKISYESKIKAVINTDLRTIIYSDLSAL